MKMHELDASLKNDWFAQNEQEFIETPHDSQEFKRISKSPFYVEDSGSVVE